MQHRNASIAPQQQDFPETIGKINEAAYLLSQKKQYDAAISKLKQAEKLLQYAAQSCKNIRRELIVLVLHNIVSLSQTKWDLSTASNYLEGLIYNYQITSSSKNNSRITLEGTPSSVNLLQQDIYAQTQLAQYYLQYCAINSQLRRHKNAQNAARKGLRIVIALIKQSFMKKSKSIQINEIESKRSILKYLLDHWDCNINEKSHAANFITACQYLWKEQNCQNKKSAIQAQLRTFSIGNVMALDYKQTIPKKEQQFHEKGFFNFIMMSMSLFSLATELRFQSEEKLNEAKHYHALSLLFYFIYVPYESPYIQHIKQNFIKNFGPFQAESSPLGSFTYYDILSKIRRDSVLEPSFNLQQESVTSVQQQKRRSERLKEQNMKLKMICLAQLKPKRQMKSQDKAKSLTISHSNAKKVSVDSKRDKNAKNGNKTNIHCAVKIDSYYVDKNHDHKKKKDDRNRQKQNTEDDIAEKYFEMAFKKEKMKSPVTQRKQSIRSTSSTTKDRSGNQSKNTVKKSKDKISSIKSRKNLKK